MARAKRRDWSGDPPATDEEARARLVAAALRCASVKGLEKTTLTDIAREAGVTRPTVYAYYEDRHAIFHAAFLGAVARLAVEARAVMTDRSSAGERAIEAVVFFVSEVPRDPATRLMLGREGLADFASRAFASEDLALMTAKAILVPMFELAPQLAEEADEVVEVVVRFALSLLMVPSEVTSCDASLRAFLAKRLLPAIGLSASS